MKSWDVCDARNDHVLVQEDTGRYHAIPYRWGLAGAAGAWFRLMPEADTPREVIREAKRCLHRCRDVVSINVQRAPATVLDCGHEADDNTDVVSCPDGAEICRDCFNQGAH